MNRPPLIFLGIFAALVLSWAGLVLASQLQVGSQEPKTVEGGDALYPARRPGLAQQGQAIYVSLGCVYCHSQEVRPRHWGADFTRGWGQRRSVAQDYLYDEPVQLGSLRMGPDLANLGLRQTNATYLLEFLYNPRTQHHGAMMPPFSFLFEKRKAGKLPSPDALKLAGEFAPPAGYEIVPKPAARKLVAYLLSLQSEAPLFEAPWPPKAMPATNAVPATNVTTTATTTNAAQTNLAPTPLPAR